jgi:4-methyl-5(b-hydroxyethyl)-thiazole monophosphate biosynthesis
MLQSLLSNSLSLCFNKLQTITPRREATMEKTALIPIADGSEEIEAVTIIDVLRRAGSQVTVASVNDLQITASRGVRITADCLIDRCVGVGYDLIALPGGMPGAQHLHDNSVLKDLLIQHDARGCFVAAICAAPAVVLQPHGLLADRPATCHPSFNHRLVNQSAVSQRVVVDGKLVTSQGPGTALAFALTLVELLFGKEKRIQVADPMIVT